MVKPRLFCINLVLKQISISTAPKHKHPTDARATTIVNPNQYTYIWLTLISSSYPTKSYTHPTEPFCHMRFMPPPKFPMKQRNPLLPLPSPSSLFVSDSKSQNHHSTTTANKKPNPKIPATIRKPATHTIK